MFLRGMWVGGRMVEWVSLVCGMYEAPYNNGPIQPHMLLDMFAWNVKICCDIVEAAAW